MEEAFSTNNRPLAMALAFAGCEFAGPELDGPAVNTYSLGFLSQPKIKRHWDGNVPMEEAAKLLIRKGIPGDVTYMFRRGPILAEVVKAWDEMSGEFRAARAESRAPIVPEIPPDVVARVMFIAANNQDEFAKLPFLNRMRQLLSTLSGNEEKAGEKTTTSGAGKVWSVFGSDKTKKHLGV